MIDPKQTLIISTQKMTTRIDLLRSLEFGLVTLPTQRRSVVSFPIQLQTKSKSKSSLFRQGGPFSTRLVSIGTLRNSTEPCMVWI